MDQRTQERVYRLAITLDGKDAVEAEDYLQGRDDIDLSCYHDYYTRQITYAAYSYLPSGVLRAIAQTACAKAKAAGVRARYSIVAER